MITNHSANSAAAPFALSAILLWSFLALLGSRLVRLPPLLMTGVALSIGGTIGLIRVREWKVPLKTLCVGVGGIFGYHFLLFTAFRHAPTVEANLINYLWPLLIVLLSPVVLSGYGLGLRHVLGALAGLAGAALIVTGGSLALECCKPARLLCRGRGGVGLGADHWNGQQRKFSSASPKTHSDAFTGRRERAAPAWCGRKSSAGP